MIYKFLKYWVKGGLRLFYYRHQVVGTENIPDDGGLIFAANHQNAPMDAFNIICNSEHEPYFATRGSAFKNKNITKILHYLKLYPVYRPMDGWRQMSLNNDAFDFFGKKLLNNKSVGIFPEGAPAYNYRLLPLKKGMARLAFQALEKNPSHIIYIIPTGFHYERKHDYMGDMLIQFSKPIQVNNYYSDFLENKNKAIRNLTLKIESEISNIIIDIQDKEKYEEINNARKIIYNNSKNNLIHRFKEGKNHINNFEQNDFTNIHKKNQENTLMKILGFPFLIFGLITHYPIRRLIDNNTLKKTKDSQFLATGKFLKGLFIFSFYYLSLIFIILIFLHPVYIFILPLIPVSGRYAYRKMNDIP